MARRAFGAKVQMLRQARGLTQAALAARLGLSAVFIRKVEAGERWPSLPNLEKLARVLSARLRIDLVARARRRER